METIEQSAGAAGAGGGEPERVLGTLAAACVVIGAIIGVGIFFTPSQVAALTGSGGLALLAWGIGGGIALCGALTFASLGTRYHASGAQYEILRDAYGPLPAFAFVFCNSTAIQPGAIAIIGVICARHLWFAAAGGEAPPWAIQTATCVLILGLMGANILGVRWGSAVQNLTVVAKVLTLLAVAGLAAFAAPPEATLTAAPVREVEAPMNQVTLAIVAVTAALVPAFFSYGGWQHALWIAGEVREPRRTLPRAIVGGVLLVVIVYLLANWAYLRLLGEGGVAASRTLAADAAAAAMPTAGPRLIAGAVAVSAFGVLNAQLLSGPRLVYGMARDGRFFPVFAGLHRRFRTPSAAVLLLGLLAIVLLLVAGFDAVDRLLTGVVAVDGVFFGLTGAAWFMLRRREGEPMRIIGNRAAPALFVVGELAIVAGSLLEPSRRSAALIGLAWIGAAVALYLARFRTRRG